METKETLKERIKRLKLEKNEINKQLEKAYNDCEHRFEIGYLGDSVVYCVICDRDAEDIFPNMNHKHIEKLVSNGK